MAISILLLLEGVVTFGLNNPRFIDNLPRRYKYPFIAIYTWHDRNTIAMFGEYNDKVLYRIKKDITYHWHNREFEFDLTSNSQGFRDDENSLKEPEIIVAGDSFSMGFGVVKPYSSLIEEQLNKKTLNTSIESYGTAREVLSVNDIDLSNAKYLIWQYCENDLGENLNKIHNKKLQLSSKQQY